eukprot:CAMPEP_0184322186 /NCGR_PEP_ID=MMETSP1049-20130417/123315_1 /TAXON_ID=77928 /ORGANISM="Proteomonas sulcata, Strain CCMP704" /LENGTH=142 /DNA_ID=CAMNT_0026643237 /DNA_START=41 /DNA_END=469 /DNA_ORIENTATION=-
MFEGTERSWGVRVSLLYGSFEAVFLGVSLLTCWKSGWTFAPPHEKIWYVILGDYQFHAVDMTAHGDFELANASLNGRANSHRISMVSTDSSPVENPASPHSSPDIIRRDSREQLKSDHSSSAERVSCDASTEGPEQAVRRGV